MFCLSTYGVKQGVVGYYGLVSQGFLRTIGPAAGTLPIHGRILVLPLTMSSQEPHLPSSQP